LVLALAKRIVLAKAIRLLEMGQDLRRLKNNNQLIYVCVVLFWHFI
jgi:hypothetical protein